MRSVVILEVIGDNYHHHYGLVESRKAKTLRIREYIKVLKYGRPDLRPWVARLTGFNGEQFIREYIRGVKHWELSNSIGSRGIYESFALRPGVYEVNRCVELGKSERVFMLANEAGDEPTEIIREQAIEWLEKSI